MKLQIKKKYFDLIKSGKKEFEYRDAHITFICEETGETLRKEITGVNIIPLENFKNEDKDFFKCFEDDIVVSFKLGDKE